MNKTAVILLILVFTAPSPALAVHDERGKTHCLDCHAALPFLYRRSALSYREGTEKVCMTCHSDYHGGRAGFTHPINIIPSMKLPPDFPVDSGGKITCITCHTFHQGYRDEKGRKKYFLRRSRGKFFCYSCHGKRLTAAQR